MSRAVPILMYHQVTPHPEPAFRKYAITPRRFALHMLCVSRLGYTPITLDVLLGTPDSWPKRPVVITFDDGYQDSVEYAVPILRARGFTAVFYLVAGFTGRTSRWLQRERGVEFPLLGWETARWLDATGFSCGSHTLTHPRLAGLSPAACRDELRRSRELLEDQLGGAVRDLAYPFGSFNPEVRAIAQEEGYRSACSVRIGLSDPADDPLALHRVPVNGGESVLDFLCRLRSGLPCAQLARAAAAVGRRRLSRTGGLAR